MATYLTRRDGKTYGPFDHANLVAMAARGELLRTDEISSDRGATWQSAGALEGAEFNSQQPGFSSTSSESAKLGRSQAAGWISVSSRLFGWTLFVTSTVAFLLAMKALGTWYVDNRGEMQLAATFLGMVYWFLGLRGPSSSFDSHHHRCIPLEDDFRSNHDCFSFRILDGLHRFLLRDNQSNPATGPHQILRRVSLSQPKCKTLNASNCVSNGVETPMYSLARLQPSSRLRPKAIRRLSECCFPTERTQICGQTVAQALDESSRGRAH